VLEIYEPCFPRKAWRDVLGDVKALADALGERRDPDVHLAQLEEFAAAVKDADRPGVEVFAERVRSEQGAGNEALAAALAALTLTAMALAASVSAVSLAACGGSGPAIDDPTEIVTQGIEATTQLTSAHIAVTLDGTASIPELGNQLTLDGTTVEGDFDLEASQAHLSFSAMGFTGELIQDGADSYVKMPLTGPKWLKSTGAAGDPTAELSDPTAMLQGVRDFLDTEGVDAEKLSDTDCGSGRCYAVRLTIPAEQLAGTAGVAGVEALVPSRVTAAA